MRSKPINRNVIRQLRSGEAVPDSPPRRYGSGQGYIRLRWRVAPCSYVEVYEHRVVDGYVTTAEQVHHKNRVRDDNRPENLEHLTSAEHTAEHRAAALERAQRLAARYEAGRSIPQLAREFELDTATVYRRLADLGVQMRSKADYAKPIDEDYVLAEYAVGRGFKAIGRELGVSLDRVRAVVERSSIPLRGPGRVPGVGKNAGEGAARRIVRERALGCCEVRMIGVCLGRSMSFHHRMRRSQGGLWTVSNGLSVCGDGTRGCHGALTDTQGLRDAYVRMGWIVNREDDPAEKRAYIHSSQYFPGQWVPLLLKENGDVELAGEPVAPYVLAGVA